MLDFPNSGLQHAVPRWRASTRETQSKRGRVSPNSLRNIIQCADLCLLLVGCVWIYRLAEPRGAQIGFLMLGESIGFWIAAICLARLGAYNLLSLGAQARAIALAILFGSAGLAGTLGVLHPQPAIWLLPALWMGCVALLLGTERCVFAVVVQQLRSASRLENRIALLGYYDDAAALFARIQPIDKSLTRIAAAYHCSRSPLSPATAAVPLRGGIADLYADAQRGAIDAIIITLKPAETRLIDAALHRLRGIAINIYVLADPARSGGHRAFRGIAVQHVAEPPLSEWQRLHKAIFDYICATTLTVVLSPVLLGIAALIKLDSEGPALFRQEREGYNGILFNCYKFRTMYWQLADACADRQTTRDDPRVTRIGRWLRKLSLDELPQLLNVLRGEMSLVGPRPHALQTKAGTRLFADVVAQYPLRHRIKPGITGWAQVNGWRGETRSEYEIHERVRYDLYYIENWSILLDLRILLMTAWRGVFSDKAY
jgi:Undecaprenyl-phosphate glucose phosphotransferase